MSQRQVKYSNVQVFSMKMPQLRLSLTSISTSTITELIVVKERSQRPHPLPLQPCSSCTDKIFLQLYKFKETEKEFLLVKWF